MFRTSTPRALVSEIRRTVAEVVPDATRVEVITGREIVARDLGRQRLGAWFFSGFGLVALLLGVGGVSGLVAYLTQARQREYGVRLALGATPRKLVRHAVSTALAPVACGTVAGLAGARARRWPADHHDDRQIPRLQPLGADRPSAPGLRTTLRTR